MLNHANLVLLVQLHGWFPSMHTHHAWVLLEKKISSDFWVWENLGCYTTCLGLSRDVTFSKLGTFCWINCIELEL